MILKIVKCIDIHHYCSVSNMQCILYCFEIQSITSVGILIVNSSSNHFAEQKKNFQYEKLITLYNLPDVDPDRFDNRTKKPE
jgi:hypothetical protein